MARSDEIRQELEHTQEDLERTANEVGDRVEKVATSVEGKVRPPSRKARRRAAKAAASWARNPIVLMAAATTLSLLALRALRRRGE